MKKSLKIFKVLFALFCVALVFAAIGIPDLFGAASMALAFPLVLASFENSDAAKRKRYEIHQRMEQMVKAVRSEKRSFTSDEQKEYDELRSDFEAICKRIDDLLKDEKRSLIMAGKYIKEIMEVKENGSGWVDPQTLRSIPTIKKGESFQVLIPDEERGLSFGRLVQASITGQKRFAENELRAMSTDALSAGATVPISLFGSIIDRARELSVLGRASGLQITKMETQKVTVAKFKTDPEWKTRAENANVNVSSIQTDAGELAAKNFGVVVPITRELAADSPNFASALDQAIAKSLALVLDQAFLLGNGLTTNPLGIYNTAGVQEIEHNGPIDYDVLIDAWAKLAAKNADPRSLFLNPRDTAILTKMSKTDLGYTQRPDLLSALDFLYSAAIPVNLGTGENEGVGLMGDFSQSLMGIRQDALFEVTTVGGDAFNKHQVLVKCTFRGDILALRPDHFLKITKLTTIPPVPPT